MSNNLTLNLIREAGRKYHAEQQETSQRAETTRRLEQTGDPFSAFRAAAERNAARSQMAEAAQEAAALAFVTGGQPDADLGSLEALIDGCSVKLGGYSTVSEKQARWILDICKRREVPRMTVESTIRNLERGLSRAAGSEFITRFKDLPMRKVASAPVPQVHAGTQPARVERDGIYVDAASGRIFKVQFNKASGDGRRLYAKRLVVSFIEEANGSFSYTTISEGLLNRERQGAESQSWEYQTGLIDSIKPEWRLTPKLAEQWGALYGTCIRCLRTLTKESSIQNMMGDTCASKQGF